MKLVECVPNFSEGRDDEKIKALLKVARSVPNVTILDIESDVDHNRSVLSLVGPPDEIAEVAFRLAKKAMELIDLNKHKGEHPRMGATDVIPFIPISEVTMDECVEIAKKVAERIAKELNIPTYLYEEAATRPERRNLAVIRKGEFEGLREEIKTNPDRYPDFGPNEIHPTAGATAVGARHPLIAFNVYLSTNDINIAKTIARNVRNSGGGLRDVKALGFEIKERNLVQVSMNMVNYKGTPLYRVLELIRAEAKRYGVTTVESEIVGLVPQEALNDSIDYYMQLNNFSRDQILEVRLQKALAEESKKTFKKLSIEDFMDKVSSGKPTPGGGTVSALAGALSASLGTMVANLTIGKEKYKDVEDEVVKIKSELHQLKTELEHLMDEDSQAFEKVMAAYKLPKETDEEKKKRAETIEQATIYAAEVPMKTAKAGLNLLELLEKLVKIGNKNAISDIGVAALLAKATIEGALFNVKINLSSIKDQKTVDLMNRDVTQIKEKTSQLVPLILETIESNL